MTGGLGTPSSNAFPKDRGIVVTVHDEKTSSEDVLLNGEFFPKWKEGDYIQIFKKTSDSSNNNEVLPGQREREKTEKRRRRLVLKVKTIVQNKGKTFQISLLSTIAAAFDLPARSAVVVKLISPEKAEVEFLEIAFKDQYLGRSDMWRLKSSLCNSCTFTGKLLQFTSVKVSWYLIIFFDINLLI